MLDSRPHASIFRNEIDRSARILSRTDAIVTTRTTSVCGDVLIHKVSNDVGFLAMLRGDSVRDQSCESTLVAHRGGHAVQSLSRLDRTTAHPLEGCEEWGALVRRQDEGGGGVRLEPTLMHAWLAASGGSLSRAVCSEASSQRAGMPQTETDMKRSAPSYFGTSRPRVKPARDTTA